MSLLYTSNLYKVILFKTLFENCLLIIPVVKINFLINGLRSNVTITENHAKAVIKEA